jgi:hypothetical protein
LEAKVEDGVPSCSVAEVVVVRDGVELPAS